MKFTDPNGPKNQTPDFANEIEIPDDSIVILQDLNMLYNDRSVLLSMLKAIDDGTLLAPAGMSVNEFRLKVWNLLANVSWLISILEIEWSKLNGGLHHP